MRLAELNASFISSGGEGVTRADGTPVPHRAGIGVAMDCPCGCEHRLYVPFQNPIDGGPPDGGHGWTREGTTLEALTLAPSIQRNEPCPKRWHGFIRNGQIVNA